MFALKRFTSILTALSFVFLTFFFVRPLKAFAAIDASSLSKDAPMSFDKYVGANDGAFDGILKALDCRIESCPDANIQGVLPVETKFVADLMIERPASSQQYLAHLMENIGLPTPQIVHAQGTGYRMFSPIIRLWQIFRNLAYTIYILIFLVIGFMIMFRTKVNAQTVINIQSALPNLIFTLILITFSYAIAGFMVDLMYFFIYFIVYLAGTNHLLNSIDTINYFLHHNLIGIFFPLGQSDVIMNNIGKAVDNFIFGLLGSVHSASWFGSYLFKVIVGIGVILQLARLLFSLLKSYLMVIIQIITAPIQILPNALPGSKAFMTWLKTLAAYLAPFPMLTALLLFAAIFATPGMSKNPFGIKNDIFSHNRMGTFPYISGVTTTSQDIASLLALVLILISPAVVKMSQDFFKVKESPYASEVMTGLKSSALPFQMASGWWNRHRANLNQRNLISAIQNQGKDDASGGRRT